MSINNSNTTSVPTNDIRVTYDEYSHLSSTGHGNNLMKKHEHCDNKGSTSHKRRVQLHSTHHQCRQKSSARVVVVKVVLFFVQTGGLHAG